MKYTIDAKDKKIGRIASEAASYLMGKNRTDYVRNAIPDVSVTITNAAKVVITQKKASKTEYAKYSGYPGGLRYEKLSEVAAKKGYREVIRRAVFGMLPTNKLRPRMIKKLTISE